MKKIKQKTNKKTLNLVVWFQVCESAVCVAVYPSSGGLRGSAGLCDGGRQLLVRDYQLGGGLRAPGEAWRLHQSGELYRLDPLSHQTKTQFMSTNTSTLDIVCEKM